MLPAPNAKHADPINQMLIRRGLEAGYAVSVFEGEDWSLKRSRDGPEILAAIE